jgi:hypothetical protein
MRKKGTVSSNWDTIEKVVPDKDTLASRKRKKAKYDAAHGGDGGEAANDVPDWIAEGVSKQDLALSRGDGAKRLKLSEKDRKGKGKERKVKKPFVSTVTDAQKVSFHNVTRLLPS